MKTDVHLQRDVLEELDWEPLVDAAQVGVTAKGGVVTLTGHVPVYAEKHTAEHVAKRVHGVRAVANEIEVRPPDAHVCDDESLASAAMHALEWDAKVPDADVLVTVEDGRLLVEGTVQQPFQKASVERALRHLTGVRGVTNSIAVAPQKVLNETMTGIEAALRRSATLDSRRLSVEVDGATVTLTGEVHSHSEIQEADRIAWSGRGVRCVQNCITITPWGDGPAEEWGY